MIFFSGFSFCNEIDFFEPYIKDNDFTVAGFSMGSIDAFEYCLDTKKRNLPFSLENRIKLDEGYMLPEHIKLMLQFIPVDLTYVDENDIVLFYNRGDNRVFPRSAGIIGREVKFCHPPKSVDQVLMILREFKAGRRDEAEFWITFKGKFIHIRYFAIRDDEGTYKGVIEVSQDVTHIRGLEGQQRLLDWE